VHPRSSGRRSGGAVSSSGVADSQVAGFGGGGSSWYDGAIAIFNHY